MKDNYLRRNRTFEEEERSSHALYRHGSDRASQFCFAAAAVLFVPMSADDYYMRLLIDRKSSVTESVKGKQVDETPKHECKRFPADTDEHNENL